MLGDAGTQSLLLQLAFISFVLWSLESVNTGLKYRISNINFNITSGDRYPVPDKSAPVYITVEDGGNQECLAERFRDPQPDYSAFRKASYGHSTLEIKNRTHAVYHWNRSLIYGDRTSNFRRRKLKKHYLRSVVGQVATW